MGESHMQIFGDRLGCQVMEKKSILNVPEVFFLFLYHPVFSLQEFQNVFCGQTGKRIKLGRVSDLAVPYGDLSSPHAIRPDKQN